MLLLLANVKHLMMYNTSFRTTFDDLDSLSIL
jgi:hypothetical protein